ncbi:autoinducer binding domain-containing protein [Dokdonella sp. MW10]|uniref:autoinducer binding domain-containing protein n=1 Tax=Dokdonella sp. MW10 TaxID=2992926 RepID=UPI003F7F3DD3
MHARLESLYGLLDSPTVDEVRAIVGDAVAEAGFDGWLYASGAAQPKPTWLLDEYPRAWMAHYLDRGYFDIDPVVGHCRMRSVPCLWSSTPEARRTGYMTDFFGEAADFGLVAGVGIPLHGPGMPSGMVAVSTADPREVPSLQQLSQLHLVATFLHEAGLRLGQPVAASPAPVAESAHLTSREADCLRWAAEGKTSWEIGQLLAIGERTVTFHLQNAARKLGVAGRRQAVARAISLQLIAV